MIVRKMEEIAYWIISRAEGRVIRTEWIINLKWKERWPRTFCRCKNNWIIVIIGKNFLQPILKWFVASDLEGSCLRVPWRSCKSCKVKRCWTSGSYTSQWPDVKMKRITLNRFTHTHSSRNYRNFVCIQRGKIHLRTLQTRRKYLPFW